VFALLGANGAGKTTTLEAMEGYRAPGAGTVRVLGLDPYRDGPRVRRRIGVMLQEGGFFNELTAHETVESWRGFLTRAAPAGEVLERVGLASRGTVRVGQLSGGERRRLDLALALLGGPELLFLDEPTTGMDPKARQDTWQVVRELVAEGTTVVLTTHYLEEAQQLADRLAIMAEGRLAAIGTVADVLSGHGSRITFRIPEGLPVDQLPVLPQASGGGAPTLDHAPGGPTAVYTVDHAGAALARLHNWSDRQGLVLDGIEVRTVSLEEVFLSLVHRPEPAPGMAGSR